MSELVRDRILSKQDKHVLSQQVPKWRCFADDTLLAIAGIGLVTVFIAAMHLHPRLASGTLIYLLVIIALASTRGHYAAILAAVLAGLSFDFLLVPPNDQFVLTQLDDLLDPVVFLGTAIVTGQLIAALRHHAEQARRREHETRVSSEQAQELAAFQERQRLAYELHDSISQALYCISLAAHTAREACENDPAEVLSSLEYVIVLAEVGLTDMRALIFELRLESLAAEGMIAVLTKQAAILRTRYKLSVDAQLGEEPDLSLECKQVLCRIAQEALHNIVKHARAHTVLLSLSREDSDLVLEIRDDGRGFDPTQLFPGHLGLHSIQQRVARLHGTYSIASAPTQGTCLRVRIPHPS